MILLFIALGALIGLNLTYAPLPLIIVVSIIFLVIAFKRLHSKGFIILGVVLLSGGISAAFTYITPSKSEYSGVVVDSSENYYIFQSGAYRFYVYEKDNDKQFGDILYLVGDVKETRFKTYESQFDFKEYLRSKNVNYTLNVKSEEARFILPLRIKSVKDKFLNRFDDNTKVLIDAFLFSNRDYNSSVIQAADSLNLIYLFSMSGIYFSLLLKGANKILDLAFKKKLVTDIITLVLFIPLFIFIFPKVSIIRVTLNYVIRMINEHALKKKLIGIQITSISLLLILLFDISNSHQLGSYLGYLISFFIYFTGEILSNFSRKKRPWILRALLILFLIPISSYMNGSFHPISLVLQVGLIPINLIFIVLSLFSFYIIPLPFLNFGGFIYSKAFEVIKFLDISLYMGDFGIYFVFIYYILLILGFYYYENCFRKSLVVVTSTLSTMMLISFIPIKPYFVNAIYFINVGQGDATLIQNKNHAVLIDTGGNLTFDMASETLIPFFRKKQIYKLDALITTHNDFDHSGAAPSLMKNYKVDRYLYKREDFPFSVGDLYFENLNFFKATEENETSLVFNLNFMGKKWLLMGDASKSVEKFLIDNNYDIDCDVLKVGHHGSKTSTSDEFVKAITPKTAIISCGYNNIYKHPNKEVIDTLNKYKVNIRRTDEEGTIAYERFAFF